MTEDGTTQRFDPLWRRVADGIAQRIADGTYPSGSRLPPERVLSDELEVSRVTIRKALQVLGDDGTLQPSRGRGWFVREEAAARATPWPNSLESFSETAARKGLSTSSEVFIAEPGELSLDIADELGAAPGTPCFHLRRLRLMGGIPIGIDDSWVIQDVAAGLPDIDFTHASLFQTLSDHGFAPVRAESVIEAAASDPAESEPLGLPVGAPVLRMRQIVHDAKARPIMLSRISYRGDRYRMQTTFQRQRPL